MNNSTFVQRGKSAHSVSAVPFSRASILSSVAFAFICIIYVLLFADSVNGGAVKSMPPLWWILQISIVVIGFMGIALDKRGLSLNKMHWFFIIIFMGIAPIVQLTSDYYPWGFLYSEDVALHVSWVVFLWCIVYLTAYALGNGSCARTKRNSDARFTLDVFSDDYLLAATTIVVLLKLALNGSDSFLMTGVIPETIKAASVLPTVIDKALTAIPIFSLAIMKLKRGKAGRIPALGAIYLLAASLYIMNPITTSRYMLGAAAIGLLVVFLPSVSKGRLFDILVLVALLVFFPIMINWARVNDNGFSFDHIVQMIEGFSLTSGFSTVDFDAYSLAARTLIYTDSFGLTNGHQLLSALFFFIPDSVWTSKGQMTSDLLVDALTPGGQKNLSTPLMAEGYIDFGIVGVVAYAILFGFLLAWLDSAYHARKCDSSLLSVAYPFMLGFVVFVMRGTLLYGYMWSLSFYIGLAFLCFPIALFGRQKN